MTFTTVHSKAFAAAPAELPRLLPCLPALIHAPSLARLCRPPSDVPLTFPLTSLVAGIDIALLATLENEWQGLGGPSVVGHSSAFYTIGSTFFAHTGADKLEQATASQMASLGREYARLGLEGVRSAPPVAAECLQRATRLLPRNDATHVAARTRLGVLHLLGRRYERAVQHLADAASQDAALHAVTRAHLRLIICSACTKLEDLDEALGYARDAERLLHEFGRLLQASSPVATAAIDSRLLSTTVSLTAVSTPANPTGTRRRRPPPATPRLLRAIDQPPALGLGLAPPAPPPLGRDHSPDDEPSMHTSEAAVTRLRAIAAQSCCACLEALGRHDEALTAAQQAIAFTANARLRTGVPHAPPHIDETFIDVRMPSTMARLHMYLAEQPLLERWNHGVKRPRAFGLS